MEKYQSSCHAISLWFYINFTSTKIQWKTIGTYGIFKMYIFSHLLLFILSLYLRLALFYPRQFCSISKSGEPHLYADIFHFIILIARIFMVFILEKKKEAKPKRNWIRMICAKRMNNIHWNGAVRYVQRWNINRILHSKSFAREH